MNKGEIHCLIGENGAGKSTSLKMLAGIIQPDEGEIKTKGVVAALLEIGLAFHPDLTGIENARLYGSVLGIGRKKMLELMPDIFSFAELDGYEHVPLKKYSSGMQVRLAFAVATIIDPDILLLDEVFSVGDQNFQEKSFSKINRFIQEGKTVLLVSHDLGVIERLCTRVMFVEKNGNVHIGKPKEMVQLYYEKLHHNIRENEND
ncbi:Teichoic acids export ATP-binding protein TagH [compost metagenome]